MSIQYQARAIAAKFLFVPLLLMAVMAFFVAHSAGAQEGAKPPEVSNGKRLYYAHGCFGCHGFNGETGARDLVATNSPLIADESTFKMYLRLRADQAPVLPVTRMPNYSATVINDAEVRDLYAFIRTFKLNAPAVDSVPTLRAILKAAERPYKP